MIEIINEKDTAYSPLALYFIIDNNIESNNEEINKYFDILIMKRYEVDNVYIRFAAKLCNLHTVHVDLP